MYIYVCIDFDSLFLKKNEYNILTAYYRDMKCMTDDLMHGKYG